MSGQVQEPAAATTAAVEAPPGAIISVFYKNGAVELAKKLAACGLRVISSGGTAKVLRAESVPCVEVSAVTGFPEMLDGRVKTIHPVIAAGILAMNKPDHLTQLAEHGIARIKVVCVNLYPFAQTVAKGLSLAEVIEMIDIGGVLLLRAAAKNADQGVIVLCDPADYQRVMDAMDEHGEVPLELRQELAQKVFQTTAVYDATIAAYLAKQYNIAGTDLILALDRVFDLAYGPNPHQQPVSLFSTGGDYELAPSRFESVEGIKPSCNNLDDLHTLRETMTRLASVFPAKLHSFALAAKHVNVCGAGIAKGKSNDAIAEAVKSMIEGDEVAIHGGVLLFNFHVTVEIADLLLHYHMANGQRRILDAIFAPGADDEAINMLSRKHGKCRVMLNPALAGELPMDPTWPLVHVGGGDYTHYPPSQFVLSFDDPELQIVGARRPEMEDCLKVGWAIGSQAKSNTITIVRQRQTGDVAVYELEGNGCGRMDRVGAAELAVRIYQRSEDAKPEDQQVGLQNAAAYSDSFMPFSDAGKVLHKAGIEVMFASSGSVNDRTVQEELTAAGMTLYLMPDKKCRGFRH